MDKILAIMPKSIGGRLTSNSIFDGFRQNDFEIIEFDELKNENFKDYLSDNYKYIAGYDFSPVKLKIDYGLKIPCIAYFSDVIYSKTSGEEFEKYYKYLKNPDIYVFLWDRKLSKKENCFYQPHFVNLEIYKDFKEPCYDVLFAGRLDTDLRLNTYIELNKKLPDLKFRWYAIKRHYEDALSRLNSFDKEIIKKTYFGFIDNETDMANIINEAKIVYNINSQGETSLNYRTIQTLACKRLIISDNREELDLFNNIIPTYNNIDDLADKIDFYIKNKGEYDKITKKSREIIELNHDSKMCIKNMLKLINGKS